MTRFAVFRIFHVETNYEKLRRDLYSVYRTKKKERKINKEKMRKQNYDK